MLQHSFFSVFFLIYQGFEQNIEAYSIKGYETFAKDFEHRYRYKSDVPGRSEESRK